MRPASAALAVIGLLTASCGDGGTDGGDTFDSSFKAGFDQSYHENFITSCIRSATGGGVQRDVAAKLCTCTSDKVKERFSVSEKMKLRDDQVMPLLEQCRAQVAG